MPAVAVATKPAPPVVKLIVPPALCDEFGELSRLRDAFAPMERKYQKCRAELAALVADADPEAEFVVAGDRWEVLISARGFENKPDVPTVRRKLGAAAFLLVAQVTKAALEKWMLKPDIEALCVESQSGPRKFVPTPIVRDEA